MINRTPGFLTDTNIKTIFPVNNSMNNNQKQQWTVMMTLSILLMVGGFMVAIVGIMMNNAVFSYFGLIMMAWVCVSWWFWVMFVIKDMFTKVDKAAHSIGEVKEEIGVVKRLITLLIGSNDK